MRRNLNINLKNQSVDRDEIDGEDVIVVGRHLIAKTLLERGIANIEALSPDNPLIFSAGPFQPISLLNDCCNFDWREVNGHFNLFTSDQ